MSRTMNSTFGGSWREHPAARLSVKTVANITVARITPSNPLFSLPTMLRFRPMEPMIAVQFNTIFYPDDCTAACQRTSAPYPRLPTAIVSLFGNVAGESLAIGWTCPACASRQHGDTLGSEISVEDLDVFPADPPLGTGRCSSGQQYDVRQPAIL